MFIKDTSVQSKFFLGYQINIAYFHQIQALILYSC